MRERERERESRGRERESKNDADEYAAAAAATIAASAPTVVAVAADVAPAVVAAAPLVAPKPHEKRSNPRSPRRFVSSFPRRPCPFSSSSRSPLTYLCNLAIAVAAFHHPVASSWIPR